MKVAANPSPDRTPSRFVACGLGKSCFSELHGFCPSKEARQPARMDGTKTVMQVAAVGPHRAMQGMGGVLKSGGVLGLDRLSSFPSSLSPNIS